MRIRITAVAKSFGAGMAAIAAEDSVSIGFSGERTDHVAIRVLEGVAGIVFRNHRFVELFTGTHADDFQAAFRRDRLGEIHDTHARYFRNENLAAVHTCKAVDHESDRLLESDPEAGHFRMCDRNRAG